MSNDFLVTLFEHKAWSNRQLVETLRAAPADLDRRQMTVILGTFEHTSIVDRIFQARLSGGEHGFTTVIPERRPQIQELAEATSRIDAWYIDYARTVSAAELETVVEFTFVADGEAGRMTKGQMLAHIITHGASHRGAIDKMFEGLNAAGVGDMMTTFARTLPA
jgi:uncharacterized damage-inducible protein DinB